MGEESVTTESAKHNRRRRRMLSFRISRELSSHIHSLTHAYSLTHQNHPPPILSLLLPPPPSLSISVLQSHIHSLSLTSLRFFQAISIPTSNLSLCFCFCACELCFCACSPLSLPSLSSPHSISP